MEINQLKFENVNQFAREKLLIEMQNKQKKNFYRCNLIDFAYYKTSHSGEFLFSGKEEKQKP